MFFYALFALALAAHIKPLKITAPVFIIVAVLAFFRRDEWPAISFFLNVLPLEFVGGIILGELALKNRKLPPTWAIILLAASCVALLVLPSGPTLGAAQGVGRVTWRLLTWGLPAFLIVASAVSLESVIGSKTPVWLRAIGDASYSIYLTHGSILFLHGLTDRVVKTGPVAGTIILTLICTIVGYGFYRIVEKPVTKRLRQI
jgi:exopolysaccharide production protein ExoZ